MEEDMSKLVKTDPGAPHTLKPAGTHYMPILQLPACLRAHSFRARAWCVCRHGMCVSLICVCVHLYERACLSSRGRGGLAWSWGPDERPLCLSQQRRSPASLLQTSRLSQRSCSAALFTRTQMQLPQKLQINVKFNVILDQNMVHKEY